MNISRDSSGVRNTINSYIDYGYHISEILDRYPQLRSFLKNEPLTFTFTDEMSRMVTTA